MSVHIDYFGDLRSLLAARMTAVGFTVDVSDNAEEVLISYLNLDRLLIAIKPRVVEWSGDLNARLSALPGKVLGSIRKIEETSCTGGDLNPYLTRKLAKEKNARFNDLQFNDWGMKHFHLGETEESPGVIEGTPELLFVLVKDDKIYFIDVGSHQDWADQNLFDIASKQWPELFEIVRLRGVLGLEQNISPEARIKLRAAGITLPTQGADGSVYASLGGGQTTNRRNAMVGMQADRILGQIQELEMRHKQNHLHIVDRIAEMTGVRLNELKFELIDLVSGAAVVIETQVRVRVL